MWRQQRVCHDRAVTDGPGWALFAAGWTLGWLLLWRTRALPAATLRREPIAVVIPARNEAAALPHLLDPLRSQLRPGDELVVVDDGSTDATAVAASSGGARVLPAPALPPGWIGKPHACWVGAGATTAPILTFLDADVRPGPDLLARLAAALDAAPEAVVSVQPWHDVATTAERASVLPNVVALMGCGAFGVFRRRTDVAFGPVLAVRREHYASAGGHAGVDVRASLTEDIALAHAVGASELYTHRGDATFRMYPDGLAQVVGGWSRTMANGVAATRWWLLLGIAAWVWSLAGGLFVGWFAYPLSAVQVWVLGRRAGRFGPVTAALYPLAVGVLVIVIVRSAWSRVRGTTTWKGRTVSAGR